MKKVILLFTAFLMILNFSCKNGDWEFADFKYKTVYFPYQYPIRTLVLGDYIYDNENDNNLKFFISVRIGGMYENKSEWKVNFQVAEELAKNLITSNKDTIQALPSRYYTLNPTGEIIIPKGKFDGRVEVQLTEDFLNDSLSSGIRYVIPLKITSSTADSILVGLPQLGLNNPDPRVAGNWVVTPKNFTLFGIKYVNNYHGNYLLRGRSVIKDLAGKEVETIAYHQKYVEDDEVWFIKTISKNGVSLEKRTLRSTNKAISGTYSMKLIFDNNNNCSITNTKDSKLPVTGTGKFVKDGDEWGNKKRNVIYLNYKINDGTYIHSVSDTLVFRDKAVTFQDFTPVVLK